jgi:hypothetical protein
MSMIERLIRDNATLGAVVGPNDSVAEPIPGMPNLCTLPVAIACPPQPIYGKSQLSLYGVAISRGRWAQHPDCKGESPLMLSGSMSLNLKTGLSGVDQC